MATVMRSDPPEMLFRGSEFGIYSSTWLSVGVVFIAGNHDDILDPTNHHFLREHLEARQLLHDLIKEDPTVQCPANTWTTFRGLKIYGCPTVYLRQSHDVRTCADVSLSLTFSIMITNSRIQWCRGRSPWHGLWSGSLDHYFFYLCTGVQIAFRNARE
jgi:hypothetical protein